MDMKIKILEAADSLFADKGYQLSMSEIANEVGIKVPSIYSHYTGKDDIIFHIVKQEMKNFYVQITEEYLTRLSKPFDQSLEELYYFILNYYSKENRLRFWRNISLIQNEELKKACVSYLVEQEKLLSTHLEVMFKEGIESGKWKGKDSKKMVTFYLILIRGVMDWMIVYQNSEEQKDTFFKEIWQEYLAMKQI